MPLSKQIREFFYSLSATDKYSDFDSRKSFNRINKPDVETSLLGASHANDSSSSISRSIVPTESMEGVHEVRLAWRHVKKWLHKYSADLNNSLLAPCTEADINELEKDLGCHFPKCVVEFFRMTDGQSTFNDNGCCGLFYGLRLLPIDEIAVVAESWKSVYESIRQQKTDTPVLPDHPRMEADLGTSAGFKHQTRPAKHAFALPEQHCVPPNTILPMYAHALWIPLISDGAGNFIGVDLSPDSAAETAAPEGKSGQVILFGRDFDTKYKIADTFGDFLLLFANDLESGNWDLRSSSDDEDMVSGVDADLVFVDHETRKEIPYLHVLRSRVIEHWLASLSQETLELKQTQDLLCILEEQNSVKIPAFKNETDRFINENLCDIDAMKSELDTLQNPLLSEGSSAAGQPAEMITDSAQSKGEESQSA